MKPEVLNDYLTEEEVCQALKIKPQTLRGRLSNGTNHPPYVKVRSGVRLYHKRMFVEWIGKLPVQWEAKSATR